jgi:hypothetical protein
LPDKYFEGKNMIDPVTAIGLATTAYNGIKQAISTGREISDMGKQLGQWATAISDLDFAHKQLENPPMFKRVLSSNIEQDALEAWAHKKKAQEMREELRSYISLYYGPSAWDEIVKIEAEMRKKRKEMEYAAIERKETIIAWIVGILCFAVGLTVMVGVLWLMTS